MDFFRRAAGEPRSLGVFPGTFNPPTRAHLALARAALARVDEVLFVLPRQFPHKRYEGASFDDRVRMLKMATEAEPRFSIASTDSGMFIEIARECRQHYPPETALYFLCGRDAAERIVNWQYDEPDAIRAHLCEYQLLVAPREGSYQPASDFEERIHALRLDGGYDELSATAIRERIRRGEPWEDMVPEPLVEAVREIYGVS